MEAIGRESKETTQQTEISLRRGTAHKLLKNADIQSQSPSK